MLTPARAKLAIATSVAMQDKTEDQKETIYKVLTSRAEFHRLLSKVGLYPVLLNMFPDKDIQEKLNKEAAKYWHK